MPRIIATVLLVVYALLVVQLTLEPPSAGAWAFSLADRMATRVSSGQLHWSQTEVLANIALFVPAGFLLAIMTNRPWLAAMLCLVASVGIETSQLLFLPSRVATIADVQHNSLGGLIGAVVAWPLVALLRPSRHRNQQPA
jgi:glycopeptide antibiotics resistance protein